MDKKNIVIVILSLVIVCTLGYLGYNYIVQDSYMKGADAAFLVINQQIYSSLANDGHYPFSFYDGEQTQTINLVPYQQPEISN